MLNSHQSFRLGVLYFFLMLLLESLLPAWTGEENSIIENLQLVILLTGFIYCFRNHKLTFPNCQGNTKALWKAGMIYFFLLSMREISWGRTFIYNADGSQIQYSQMGLYGKLVHPAVAILIITLIILLYRARIGNILRSMEFPQKPFCLLLIFIFAAWIAERTSFIYFHGQVAEELAEFGAYMMMLLLVYDTGEKLKK